ncbi:MAG: dehydrogenase, quinone family [Myxococcaceae bacterium]|nr:dehydrogenase, quinone family [Myxococcaceae bacterium]
MNELLVIVGHADPRSFTHALAHAYERAASMAGASTTLLELASLRFDPVLFSGHRGEQALEPDLERAQAAIEQARHVAWFFPTWWAGPPALLKGFVDRTFLPGFAYRYEAGRALQHKLLRGRSTRLVTTMDAPWWYYALFQRRALHRSFVHATLGFVGFAPLLTTTAYGLRRMSAEERARLLAKLARIGAADAKCLGQRRRAPARAALPAQASEGSSRSSASPSAMR